MKKSTRKIKAKETLEIIETGLYVNAKNETIHLKEEIHFASKNARYYSSEELDEILDTYESNETHDTMIEVVHEDSVSAIIRLARTSEDSIMCLNFASAKNPGGGFLNGALAQEESLAVSSSLYDTQMANFEFYEQHRNMKSCLYTDAMIYSPEVPLFRNNKGELLEDFVQVNFITSAAVNAGVVKRNEVDKVDSISDVMKRRIEKMLALSAEKGNQTLLLGAWGCGVFQNDPQTIASLFNEALNHRFKNQFKRVVFAIYSRNEKFISAFQEVFEE